MIDKRTAIGKMIDEDKVVYVCIICGRRFIGDLHTDINSCPRCNTKAPSILVMDGNLIVRK